MLDPSFYVDGRIRQEGLCSALILPLLRGEHLAGFVSVASRRAGAFTAEHETALQPIADLLALALEHERLWNLDASRRHRLASLVQLYKALGGGWKLTDPEWSGPESRVAAAPSSAFR